MAGLVRGGGFQKDKRDVDEKRRETEKEESVKYVQPPHSLGGSEREKKKGNGGGANKKPGKGKAWRGVRVNTQKLRQERKAGTLHF